MTDRDPTAWLTEALATRDLDRIQPDMAAAGNRINDARATVKAARTVQSDAPTFSIAGCHDAARKAITAHMVATGYRPKRGEGAHRIVIDYARHVLADAITEDDLEALDGLRRDRGDAEYGDFAQRRFDLAHLEEAAALAERIVNGVAERLARPSGR
jgi:hypothetical protein